MRIGCTGTSVVTISSPQLPVWVSATSGNPNCATNTGWVNGSASSANTPMSYTLMPVNITNATGSFTNLAAGNYILTASDNSNCDTTTSFILAIPPPLIWATPGSTNVSCNGGTNGTINLNRLTGGTPTLSYNLIPGNVTNGTGAYTNLSAGNYTITATDANNCTLSTTLSITQPPVLSITNISSTTPSCVPGNDGSITVTATGGTPTYQYNIGGPNQASNIFSNVGSGIYTVTVTDANNCTTTTSVNIVAPNAPSITNISSTTPSCLPGNDGSITVTATGGTPTYQYNIGGPNQTSNVFSNVGSGIYTVTVTDANNCTTTTSVNIVAPNAPSITNISSTTPSCLPGNDGSITVTATGGTPTYQYNIGGPNQASNIFSNLGSGIYTVTVTDANNCTTTTSVNYYSS